MAWGKPILEKCPDCGSSYLIEKFLKAGPVAQCPNKECKFKHPIEVPPEVRARNKRGISKCGIISKEIPHETS